MFVTRTHLDCTSSTSTTFYTAPSGTQYSRIGSGAGSFNLENQTIAFGTGSYMRGVAATGTSYNFNKVSAFASATSLSYIKFRVLLGSSTGTNTATTGAWHFVMGNGTSFTSGGNAPAFAEYAAGLRWTFGASGAITTAPIVTSAFSGTVSGFSQASAIDVEVYINNSASATTYTRGTTQNLASRRFDVWIGGSLVQDDFAVN